MQHATKKRKYYSYHINATPQIILTDVFTLLSRTTMQLNMSPFTVFKLSSSFFFNGSTSLFSHNYHTTFLHQ
ncbi:hypothetical protein Fmac_024535 [Flemingia macrophylla]|uniref:Uncharacterized protein n=1 Tax=Flemingia macrophylla TaxID=520843 RepID=A0ABD1LPP4_9FABA